MRITSYQAQYFASNLVRYNHIDCDNKVQSLSIALFDSCVKLTPHQIEAALFALQSPISKGVLLADEVGLGKTIEAGIVLCQLWAERKRKLLVICPAALRNQWANELDEKFNLPTQILETKQNKKHSNINHLNVNEDIIFICSYQFASRYKEEIKDIGFSMTIIDEAHKLRNVYKDTNKLGNNIKEALKGKKKILLTATPLHNNLLELYGLSLLIDDNIFGDKSSFKAQYIKGKAPNLQELKERLKPFCKRTLRSSVLEYISYTNRTTILASFTPSSQEYKLYQDVTEFLEREDSYSIPKKNRHLLSLVLRKVLASSSYAISATLEWIKDRLNKMLSGEVESSEDLTNELLSSHDINDYKDDYKEGDEEDDNEDSVLEGKVDREKLKNEIVTIQEYIDLANSIKVDSKSEALLTSLTRGFEEIEKVGANVKVIIFTESKRTQEYLRSFLYDHGYTKGEITLFSGTNNDEESKDIYKSWLHNNYEGGKSRESKAINMKAALIDHFKNDSKIMIATEAGGEGLNLQFCSLVINYDLPWNPQRIEQRIGRCHRYGQKHDVIVINFLNEKNAVDQRVYELLKEKFHLFDGVFGSSDEVIGTIGDDIDFEKRVRIAYETCRTEEEINEYFTQLQKDLKSQIEQGMNKAEDILSTHFDESVKEAMSSTLTDAQNNLDRMSKIFWYTTKFILDKNATFDDNQYTFKLDRTPPNTVINQGEYELISKEKDNIRGEFLYRISHPLGEYVLDTAIKQSLPCREVYFDITSHLTKITMIEDRKGTSGWLHLIKFTINSFDKSEDLQFIAIDDNGKSFDQELSIKLFDCTAYEKGVIDITLNIEEQLQKEIDQRHTSITTIYNQRNTEYFNKENITIQKWHKDLELTLEQEITDIKKEIKKVDTLEAKAETLEDKKKHAEKSLKLTQKRRVLRNKLSDEEEKIEEKAKEKIKNIQKKLAQKVTIEKLFTIRWHII